MNVKVKSMILMAIIMLVGKYMAISYLGVDGYSVSLGIIIGVLSTTAYDIVKGI